MEGEGGGGRGADAAWATTCSPHNTAQAYIHSITYTYFHTWRGHSSFAIRVDTTDTGYKPSLDWWRARRQGLLPTVREILGSHWTAIARLKLGIPQSVRCCPKTAWRMSASQKTFSLESWHLERRTKGRPQLRYKDVCKRHESTLHQRLILGGPYS